MKTNCLERRPICALLFNDTGTGFMNESVLMADQLIRMKLRVFIDFTVIYRTLHFYNFH